MMRLLSDAMTVRILNDLGSLMSEHWKNFYQRKKKTSIPVFFNIGYKERSATNTEYLPGVHVNIRPNKSDLDRQYWNKLILRMGLVPIYFGTQRWLVKKEQACKGTFQQVIDFIINTRKEAASRMG